MQGPAGYISYHVSPSFPYPPPFLPCRRPPSLPPALTLPLLANPMSAAAYDVLGGHFEFEQEAPPYLPNAPPPIYKPKSVSVCSPNCRPCLSPTHSWIGPHSAFHMTTTCPQSAGSPLVPARTMPVSFPSSALLSPQTLMSLGAVL